MMRSKKHFSSQHYALKPLMLSGRCAPQKVSQLSYMETVLFLEEMFTPKLNEIAESFKFFIRIQKEDESAQRFILELGSLADMQF